MIVVLTEKTKRRLWWAVQKASYDDLVSMRKVIDSKIRFFDGLMPRPKD